MQRAMFQRILGRHGYALTQRRGYNFGSNKYAAAFQTPRPPADVARLRAAAINYIEHFNKEEWFDSPVRTVVNGKHPEESQDAIDTVDAFGKVNGKQLLSSESVIDQVISHAKSFVPAKNDMRAEVRAIEAKFMSDHAGFLIGNQALDFGKQDGVTEIEESIEANVIEHRMNDDVLDDEAAGRLRINRSPAIVGCVSNFSNFLDLCRKTLRNLELGVPVVVLSRSNTTQHMFRWYNLLLEEVVGAGLEPGLLTYVSCSVEQQRRIMQALAPDSALYLTGSRDVARKIREIFPRSYASTGGPNTMVATEYTEPVMSATKMGTFIENSGQCTAMRHLVAPGVTKEDVEKTFRADLVSRIDGAVDSLRANGFDGVFAEWGSRMVPADGYTSHPDKAIPMAFRTSGDVPPFGVEEHWRRPYLDVTSVATPEELRSDEFLLKLSRWLVHEQPITVAVNADKNDFAVAKRIWENTTQVVFSVGDIKENPSLTVQARPQDGEVFGEFPPRRQLSQFTKAPVVVPSSTPGYNSSYSPAYLEQLAAWPASASAVVEQFISQVNSPVMKGYLRELANYLSEAADPVATPREGHPQGPRTTLFGLQRPPLEHGLTLLRADSSSTMDDLSGYVLPFLATNAHSQLVVSLTPGENTRELAEALQKGSEDRPIYMKLESDESFMASLSDGQVWNVLHLPEQSMLADEQDLPLVGQFISTLFPLGHIKSTQKGHREFTETFRASEKWLKFEE
uniref:Aldehyde dehydrogenase domain-containing protein n=2 Tax=Rhizochromulina marina TaxID=1034831 RepID=A0A7S2WTZ2_9STRA|mmetsp:Transcript_5071/g.15011  ORF Transcript_5071/g.15011 Transcript_5071/m.15011 type:complete len:737 (+) Transcript_5071:136-2346(+)